MDFRESDEHRLLRDSVASIASRFGHEYFVAEARRGGSAQELWDALSDAGFTGVNLPPEHGGGGGGITELAMVCEEAAAVGCPMLMLLVSPAICGSIIDRFGTEEQRARWLPGLATGRRMAFGITEADAGSNSHRISTVAERRGDHWVLRGSKTYISGVDHADGVLIVARTGVDEQTGHGRLSLFVVDVDTPGFERSLIPVEVVATEKQFTLHFDDVELSDDRLIGGEGAGLRALFVGLNPERILSAALLNGIARYALGKAAAYANERQVWGRPIGTHQGVAHPLAAASIAVEGARLMTAKACWQYDAGEDAGAASNMAKFLAADATGAALDQAIQTHGGNGMATEYGLATLWGMTRLLRIAPVSREMILNFVSQHSLGLPRSY